MSDISVRERILIQVGDIIGFVKTMKVGEECPFFGLGRMGIEVESTYGCYKLFIDPPGGDYHEDGNYDREEIINRLIELAYSEINRVEEKENK